MIRRKTQALLAWWLVACATAAADFKPDICTEPILPGLHIVEFRCDVEGGMSAFSFLGPEPTFPYASDFDRRRVVIAKATSASKLKHAGGLVSENRSPRASEFQLLAPPVEEQIVRREQIKKVVKKGGWNIVHERVTYGAQGGVPGFAMDCSTATRLNKTVSLAVAECYPLEERQRFLKTLELIP